MSELVSVDASPRTQGLARMLDDGTRESHSLAENTAFVTGFFRGIASDESFRQLVTSLYFVYKAMESALDKCTDVRVRALDFPELRRLPALEEDLTYFMGPGWKKTVQPSPATRAYVARIEEIASSRPELLIGHLYSRYLGKDDPKEGRRTVGHPFSPSSTSPVPQATSLEGK